MQRLLRLRGRRFWRVWRGYGSHLFFETGKPSVEFWNSPSGFTVGGAAVRRRSTHLKGSHSLHIEMADWTLYHQGRRVADMESPTETFRELTTWLSGQSLIGAGSLSPTSLSLDFDLGARFIIGTHEFLESADPLLSLKDEEGRLCLLADGTLKGEERSMY